MVIWEEAYPWIPPPPPDTDHYRLSGFDFQVYETANQGVTIPTLVIHGSNLEDAVDKLIVYIDQAGETGDYSKLLSADCEFTVYVYFSCLV